VLEALPALDVPYPLITFEQHGHERRLNVESYKSSNLLSSRVGCQDLGHARASE